MNTRGGWRTWRLCVRASLLPYVACFGPQRDAPLQRGWDPPWLLADALPLPSTSYWRNTAAARWYCCYTPGPCCARRSSRHCSRRTLKLLRHGQRMTFATVAWHLTSAGDGVGLGDLVAETHAPVTRRTFSPRWQQRFVISLKEAAYLYHSIYRSLVLAHIWTC